MFTGISSRFWFVEVPRGRQMVELICLEHAVIICSPVWLVRTTPRLCRRYVLWAQEVDTTVSQEDVGGLYWGLHHHCGGLLVPGWLHVQVQVDDVPSHSTSPAHVWGTHLPFNLSACAQLQKS